MADPTFFHVNLIIRFLSETFFVRSVASEVVPPAREHADVLVLRYDVGRRRRRRRRRRMHE